MENLSKLSLKKHVLNEEEQLSLLGGRGSYVCYWESASDRGCTSDSSTASFMGTRHWCCNNKEAYQKCPNT